MNSFLLDSNILIEHLAGRFSLFSKIALCKADSVLVPTIVALELRYGALRSSKIGEFVRVEKTLLEFPKAPFGEFEANVAAEIRFDLTKRGLMIGPYDLLIAATALSHDLTLVTHNTREFSRVRNLKVEDWQTGQ